MSVYQPMQPQPEAYDNHLTRKRRMSSCPEYQSAKFTAAQLEDDEAAVPSGKSDFLSPNSRNALLEALVQVQSAEDTLPQLRRADPSSSRAQTVVKVPVPAPEFSHEPLLQWDTSRCHILRKDKLALVTGVTAMLTTWLDSVKTPPFASVFNGKASVPLSEFISTLVDLVDHLRCGRETLLMTLVYVRRVDDTQCFPVSWNNIFRLLLAGVLTAVKMHDDYGLPNRRYARLIGLEVNDIISLEEHFIRQLNYSLYINEQEFVHICTLVNQFC